MTLRHNGLPNLWNLYSSLVSLGKTEKKNHKKKEENSIIHATKHIENNYVVKFFKLLNIFEFIKKNMLVY